MDIKLTARTSDWVEITNVSKANYPATIKFLERNRRNLDRVCFGDGGTSFALKLGEIANFITRARMNGLDADWASNA